MSAAAGRTAAAAPGRSGLPILNGPFGVLVSLRAEQALAELDSNKLLPSISKRGLRYDLTVPFARFVVMNQNDLSFPFKRYQIQPVWRADRPQKGRYQEFFQCDADVIGSDSLMYEAELIRLYEIFGGELTRLADKASEAAVSVGDRAVLLQELEGSRRELDVLPVGLLIRDEVGGDLERVDDHVPGPPTRLSRGSHHAVDEGGDIGGGTGYHESATVRVDLDLARRRASLASAPHHEATGLEQLGAGCR